MQSEHETDTDRIMRVLCEAMASLVGIHARLERIESIVTKQSPKSIMPADWFINKSQPPSAYPTPPLVVPQLPKELR